MDSFPFSHLSKTLDDGAIYLHGEEGSVEQIEKWEEEIS